MTCYLVISITSIVGFFIVGHVSLALSKIGYHNLLFLVSNFSTYMFLLSLMQALHANALPVLDMCKQWLAQCM